MKKLLLIAFILLQTSLIYGQSIETDSRTLIDFDNTFVQKHDIKYFHKFSNLRLGIGAGQLHINDDSYVGYNNLAIGVDYVGKHQYFEVDMNYISDGNLIYESSYRLNINEILNLELSSSRNPIGTSVASQLELFSLTNGAVIDVNLMNERLTFVGGYYLQDIDNTSNNIYRDIYLFKSLYRFKNNILIENENKMMRSDKISNLFFSPLKFDKHTLGVGYPFVVFTESAVITPKLSYGVKNLNGDYDSLFEVEIKFRSWITDRLGFSGDIAYSNSYNNWGTYSFIHSNVGVIYKLN